jgi:hypothetical protein
LENTTFIKKAIKMALKKSFCPKKNPNIGKGAKIRPQKILIHLLV